jgi:hypothetical protein
VYADNVNLLREKILTTMKNKETVLGCSKGVGLEVKVEKTSIFPRIVIGMKYKVTIQISSVKSLSKSAYARN